MAEVCPKRKSGVAKRRGQMSLAPTFQRSRGLGPMKRRLLLVLIIWMLCQPTVVVGQEPRRIGEETFISRAIFADGHVWLMSDAGVLLFITEGKDDPVEIALPEAALDLWPEDGQPAVISCSRPSCTSGYCATGAAAANGMLWQGSLRSASTSSRSARLMAE